MSDASMLKEFLVGIGFRLDKDSFDKFQKGLNSGTTAAVALGEIIAKTAETVAKAVLQMAQDMDQLYFTSRRVNAAAENIKAFGFALTQLGGTAEGAQAALEGIASFIRSNPGGERFIQSLGVQTRDVNGQLRDTTKIAEDLGKHFASLPFYMAKVQAALLGIDEKTLIALENPKLDQETHKYDEFARRLGLGLDGGADAANTFAEKLRDLQAEFGLLIIAVGEKVLPYMERLADWLSQLPFRVDEFKRTQLGQTLIQIAGAILQVITSLAQLAATIWKIVGPAVQMLAGVQIKGLIDVLHYLRDTLNLINDLLTGNWSKAWKDYAKAGVDAMRALARSMESVILLGMKMNPATAGMVGATKKWIDQMIDQYIPAAPGDRPAPGAPIAPSLTAPPVPGTLGEPTAPGGVLGPADGSGAPIVGNRERAPRSVRNLNPGNLRDPVTGQYRSFASAEAGQAAMRRQLLRDFTVHGLRTVASLINDPRWGWSSERAAGNSHASTMNYIASIARALGVRATDQINLADPNTLSTVMNAMARFESGGNYFAGARLTGGGASSGVAMHQRTDIHVHGVSDARAAGQTVAAAQTRVNSNLVRNLKTAVA